MTAPKPKPLGRIENQDWNHPLFSSRKMKDRRETTGRAPVITRSQ
jgi:hypothetical protein